MTPEELDKIEQDYAKTIHDSGSFPGFVIISASTLFRLIHLSRGGLDAKAAIDAAREEEREACAAVAGTMAERPYDVEPEFSVCLAIESAIRNRGEKTNG